MILRSREIGLLVLLLLSVSCTDLIGIDVPAEEQELAVYGFIHEGDVISVTVYRTAGIDEDVTEEDLQINDALVVIIHNGVRDTLIPQNNGQYAWDRPAINGENYQLEVEKEGYPKVYSETTVPVAPVVAAEPNYLGVSERFDTLRDFLLKVFLQDIGGSQNYQLGLFWFRPPDLGGDWARHFFKCNEVLFRINPADVGGQSVETPPQECSIVYFADESFEGQTKQFDLELEQEQKDLPRSLDLAVTSMGVHYFKYHQTLALQERNNGDPFSEPVAIYSNVTNGQGVFASYASNAVSVLFENQE